MYDVSHPASEGEKKMSAIPGGGGVVVDDGFEIENFAGIIGGGEQIGK